MISPIRGDRTSMGVQVPLGHGKTPWWPVSGHTDVAALGAGFPPRRAVGGLSERLCLSFSCGGLAQVALGLACLDGDGFAGACAEGCRILVPGERDPVLAQVADDVPGIGGGIDLGASSRAAPAARGLAGAGLRRAS